LAGGILIEDVAGSIVKLDGENNIIINAEGGTLYVGDNGQDTTNIVINCSNDVSIIPNGSCYIETSGAAVMADGLGSGISADGAGTITMTADTTCVITSNNGNVEITDPNGLIIINNIGSGDDVQITSDQDLLLTSNGGLIKVNNLSKPEIITF
jgi:hypothetical protein